MKNFAHTKTAFTMLELVMVIVVLGILASVALPRLKRDHRQDAADNILADIRYTQSLALRDFKHSFNQASWQRAFWRIGFGSCINASGYEEYIGSDINYNSGISNTEAAIDPLNGKYMSGQGQDCSKGSSITTSNRIILSYEYGVSSAKFSGSCANAQYIGFDHLGRPHQGFSNSKIPDYSSYLSSPCNITFSMSAEQNFTIVIEPETGYAFIQGQNDS